MQRSADQAGGMDDALDAIFADPAFAIAKRHEAVFAIVATESRDVVWANAAASTFWGSPDPRDLASTLFGPPEATGRGWLGSLARGFVPDRGPQLARLGPGRGFGMRGTLVLGRSWADPDGRLLTGFTVPETGASSAVSDDAWRRSGVPQPEPARGGETHPEPNPEFAGETSAEDEAEAGETPHEAGPSLARRSQLAILRDRLNAAVDGAPTLRLLWRTDHDGIATQIDDRTFARLGSPARFAGRALPEVLEGFDPEVAAKVREALATRLTWSGILVQLPVAEAAAVLPLALSASPVFGPDRSFAGFRGFGTIDLGQLDAAPHRAAAAARPDEPGPRHEPVPDASLEPHDGLAEAAAPPGDDTRVARPADEEPPVAADEAEPEAGTVAPHHSSANVVPLRRAPAAIPARAVTVATSEEPAPVAADEAPRLLSGAASEGEASRPVGEDATPASNDELAFLALGDALRAQIDLGPHDGSEPGASLPSVADDITTERSAGEAELAPAREALDPSADVAATPVDRTAGTNLLDQIPTALLVTAAGRPVFANRAAAHLLGYAEPADLLRAGDGIMPAGTSSPDHGVARVRTARGELLPLGCAAVAIDWQDAAATLWTLQPVPASRSVSDAPEPQDDAEEATGDLLDRVDDAVVLLDAGGRIRRMNRRGESWFARPGAAGVLGQSITEILAPDSRGAALALMADVKAQKDGAAVAPLRRDVMVRTGDHLPVPMVLTMGRVGPSGFYATLRDVSALKRAETERAATLRDLGRDAGHLPDVLARVSHEIRTPLNAILGFAEIIMDERFGPLGNPRYKDYLKDIHASGTQVISLVSDLLDLSRIQAGQIELDVGAVDVNKIVSEAVAQMQPDAHRERVIMRTSLGTRIPSALVDERSARQIVQNLLSNAVKFNEPGGQVIVSTALGEPGTVVLRVRDTGIGMSDAEIAAALEPFQRASSAGPGAGNGLGLPLTRALIGANGASMAIRSRPREGTLVEVAFASAPSEEARLPA